MSSNIFLFIDLTLELLHNYTIGKGKIKDLMKLKTKN